MNLLTRIADIFKKKSTLTNPSAWFPMGFPGVGASRKIEELYYGIIFACIDAIASSVASTDVQLFIDDGDGVPNELFDDPILKPFIRANRFQSGSDVLYTVVTHMKIHGMSYIWPRKSLNGTPFELWAIDPTKIRIVKSSTDHFDGFILGYVYNAGGMTIPFEVEELIPIYRPHPFDQHKGVAPLEMARLEAEADLNAQEYNRSFFERGAKPSGILTTEEEIGEEAWERLKTQWAEVNENRKDSWQKTLFLENGLKYQQTAINQKDMDFIEQRKLSRDDIMAIFKVPKTILAISDDVNRANAESGEYVFAKYTLLPDLQLIFKKLNSFYVPLFPNSERKFLAFENPVPDDVRMLSEVREKSIYKWKTINEIRSEDGLESIGADGDQLFIPINLMPLGMESDTDSEDNPKEEPKNGKKTLKTRTKSLESGVGEGLEQKLAKIVQTKSRERSFLLASKRYLAQREKQMTPAIRQLYADLIREVRKNPIAKDAEDSAEMILELLMPRLDNFKTLSASVILRYNTDTFTEGMKNVNEYYELPVNFDLINSGAINYLRAEANDTANSLRDSMIDKARLVISDTLEDSGFTLDTAKKNILGVFKDEADWRSERVARTEVQRSYNEANFRSYKESGMVEKLKWIVSASPCEICESNAGAIIKMGETFPSGHDHPIVHPNCSCGVVPYFGI